MIISLKIIRFQKIIAHPINLIKKKLNLYYSDLQDASSLNNLISLIEPDEVYNLAAQSHVAVSFKNPIYTTQAGNQGTLSILEAIKNVNKDIKFYQASSSEMFGGDIKGSLNENSPFEPKSPYAASKVFSHNITKLYRESYDIFASNGILFNHESPLRGETFVTRKITKAVGRISLGLQKKLTLGNLNASRDWGFAGDYVEAMWMMLQHTIADDWVVATGETHTVQEFVDEAFNYVSLDSQDYVTTSKRYFRPNEVDYLLGDSTKASKELGWKPKITFKELVNEMANTDLRLAEIDEKIKKNNLILSTHKK